MDNQNVHAMKDFKQTTDVDFTDNEITSLAIPVFTQRDDPTICLNKAMAFQSVVAASRFPSTNNQLRASSNLRNQTTIQDAGLLCNKFKGGKDKLCEGHIARQCNQHKRPRNAAWFKDKAMLAEAQESKVPHFEPYYHDMDNQNVHAMKDFKQTTDVDFTDNEITNKEIDLEKKIKELDNIVYKVDQSAQTVHTLTTPQVFYNDTHKQALGYQNPFYLKKAQWIKLTLYDGSVISSQHVVIPIIDDEETLIFKEVNRSKMFAKQNDPISKEKKINYTPINYFELNQLFEDFGKRFVSQQELSAKQAFWLQTSHPNTDQSDISPVKTKAPREHPKEHCDSLIAQLNSKSLNSRKGFCDHIFEKRFTKLKGKEIIENSTQKPNATTIAPGMFKLDLHLLAPRLLKTKDAHIDYLKYTQEQANILQRIVKQAKAKQPLDNALDFSWMFKLDLHLLAPRLLKTKDAHIDYLKYTQEQANILQRIVKQAKAKQPLDNALDFSYVPSSSSLVNDRLSILFYGIWTPDAQTYDREQLLAHELYGVDLLSGSRDTNLYMISLDDMLNTSLICLLSKASKTKSRLWHHRLSHLNFGTLNKLAKGGLARGIPILKFKKDHPCLAYALGKSKK
nr:hypothetical protein [Tanacetum cinerariifolium]